MRLLSAPFLLACLLSLSLPAQVCPRTEGKSCLATPAECPRTEGKSCPERCTGKASPCLANAGDAFTSFFHALGNPAVTPTTMKELTVRRQASVLFATDKVVSLQIQEEGYLGGAHGFRNVNVFTLLRTQDGPRKLTLEDLATPEQRKELEEKLLQALQEEYRRRGATPPKDNVFPRPALTENFYYDAQGLHFFFNRYEIDCYAAGEFDLCVDWPLPSCAQ